MSEDPERRARELRNSAMLSSVGLTLALSVGIGIGAGLLLDHWLKTRGLVIVGALLGVAAGFRELIRAVVRISREESDANRAERESPDE